MFVEEKMELEAEISRMKAKAHSDAEFISQLEADAAKAHEKTIKVENKLRKMAISYEEDTFQHKWSR